MLCLNSKLPETSGGKGKKGRSPDTTSFISLSIIFSIPVMWSCTPHQMLITFYSVRVALLFLLTQNVPYKFKMINQVAIFDFIDFRPLIEVHHIES